MNHETFKFYLGPEIEYNYEKLAHSIHGRHNVSVGMCFWEEFTDFAMYENIGYIKAIDFADGFLFHSGLVVCFDRN